MLSRSASLRLPLRFLTITIAASSHSRRIASSPLLPPSSPLPPFYSPSPNPTFYQSLRPFSTRRGDDNDGGDWKFTPDADEADSIFGEAGDLAGIADGAEGAFGSEVAAPGAGFKGEDSWEKGPDGAEGAFGSEAAAPGAGFKGEDSWEKGPVKEGTGTGDAFGDIDLSFAAKESVGEGEDEWQTAEGYKPWTFGDDGEKADLFDFSQGGEGGIEEVNDGGDKPSDEELKQLEKKEEELLAVLKGPNRAFGDLIAQSGITEDMIDSLILMKDVRGIKGLPPLPELQERAVAKLSATSTRTEIERKKQEEIAKARVRQVDEKGRAYGTGRRKCSIARVWIKPGDGKFLVNEMQFDSYFPILDHRADLLQPFTVTKTLGLWDVNCTVKGGGVSGQVGAIRLGISRALQNWEPGLRPYLKAAGFLSRDPRVVERKKPGKAKARKSFQWVKR